MTQTSKEKNIHFINLMLFYIAMSVVFYYSIFSFHKTTSLLNENVITAQIDYQNQIWRDQEKYIPVSDSINKIIMMYNPGSSQVFMESSLNYELEELRKGYNSNLSNENYKILHLLDEFYSMQYFDKKAILNAGKNTEFFKKNQEDCEIGFQQMQNNLQLQEALKAK